MIKGKLDPNIHPPMAQLGSGIRAIVLPPLIIPKLNLYFTYNMKMVAVTCGLSQLSIAMLHAAVRGRDTTNHFCSSTGLNIAIRAQPPHTLSRDAKSH